jgi:serine/threonine-protein kinase HipA
MDAAVNWTLAPDYYITFSQSAHGHHSISVAGESKNPSKKNLLQLADTFGLKNANDIIDQVYASISKWPVFADEAGVSRPSRIRVGKALKN